MKVSRAMLSSLVVCLLPYLGWGQNNGRSDIFLRYQCELVQPPLKSFSWSPQVLSEMAKAYRDKGLSEDQIKRNLSVMANEEKVIRAGKKVKNELKIIIEGEALGIQKRTVTGGQSGNATLKKKPPSGEYLNANTYAFFYGTDPEVEEFAQGTVVKADLLANDSSSEAPGHWLPNSIGHRFALCLIGYQEVGNLLKKMQVVSKSGSTGTYKEGRYYWTLSLSKGNRLEQIDWRVDSPDSMAGIRVKIGSWKEICGREAASSFKIEHLDNEGRVKMTRSFQLTEAIDKSKTSKESLFQIIPSGTAVVDKRPTKPATYRLKGSIPPIEEASQYTIPDQAMMVQKTGGSATVIGWIAIAGMSSIGLGVLWWHFKVRPHGA